MLQYLRTHQSIIKKALMLACIVYLAQYLWVNREHLGVVFAFSTLQVVLIIALITLHNFVYALRLHHVFSETTGKSFRYMEWLKLAVLGRFLNHFVPQLGNVYRSLQLKSKFQINHTVYASSFVSFIWLDICVNLLIAIVTFHYFSFDLVVFDISLLVFFYVFLCILALTPFLIYYLSHFEVRTERFTWLKGRFDEAIKIITNSAKSPVFLFTFICLTLLSSGMMITFFYLMFSGIGIQVEKLEMVVFNLVHRLASNVVITPGNLGLRELAYGTLSASFSMGLASGVIVSGALRVLSFVILFVLGFVLGGRHLVLDRKKILEEKPKN
jgi:uncharacterized membrane protein YbhN (UPF0104 family)